MAHVVNGGQERSRDGWSREVNIGRFMEDIEGICWVLQAAGRVDGGHAGHEGEVQWFSEVF